MIQMPEQVEREDPTYWFTHRRTNLHTKPGDIVLIIRVEGDKFGEYDSSVHRAKQLGLAATFLGMFKEVVTKEEFERQHALLVIDYPDEPLVRRKAFFRANFEGLGEIIFNSFECSWRPLNISNNVDT